MNNLSTEFQLYKHKYQTKPGKSLNFNNKSNKT